MPYKIKNGPPEGFDKKFRTRIQFRYSINQGKYNFEYRATTTMQDDTRSPVGLLYDMPFILFIRDGVVVRDALDIHIKKGDTLVEIETVPQDDGSYAEFYWSPSKDAIQTEISRKDYYGQLEYSRDGVRWGDREDYEQGPSLCRLMRFRAKLNQVYADRNQKFSFFVYLNDPQGQPVELEIDPDIKNPSA